MAALMPNASGVFPNSVQGFNASIANQSAPRPDAFGSFGTDPITGATYTDKASAQAALGQYANPNSLQSQYLASMQPTMLPGRPAHGGPSGRMGLQKPRRKIMTLGPRTSAEFTAERGSTLDNAYATGNLTNPNPTAAAPTQPTALPGGGYNVDLAQFDPPQDPTRPKMMAKGGPMKMGSKPYLVGEEGPELIMPRQNGEGFVLPADVTAQVLPAMRDVTPKKSGGKMAYTPRAEGGPMTLQSPSGRFAAITGDYGTGFASRIPPGDGIDLMASDTPRMMFDPTGRYQLNMDAPGLPMQPDTITGPFAEPAAPVTPAMRADLTQSTAGRATALALAPGTIPQSRYPGQTFADATDPTAPAIPFEELQNRVAMRSIDANNRLFDIRDTAERNRVQLDLAARNARAPLGSAPAPVSQIPGMPTMRPSTQRAIDRNQERFLRTPEGAQFAMQQQQDVFQTGQKVQERQAMIQPMPLGDTGDFIIPLTGQVISPNGRTRQITPDEATALGLVADSSENGVIKYARPDARAPRSGGFQLVPGTYDAEGNLTPARVFDTYTGLSWNEGDPIPPESLAARGGQPIKTPEVGGAATDPAQPTAPAATEAKSRVKALMSRRAPTP